MGTVEIGGDAVTGGMALLVPGGRGQLGFELARQEPLVHAPGSRELDITEADAVTDAVDSFADSAQNAGLNPVVINAAAYTAVDAAEDEPRQAAAVNERGAKVVAAACRNSGVPMIHVSTDYVFAGEAEQPYEPSDTTQPRTVYGRTKRDGERAVLGSGAQAWVVRTAWVYGACGSNFVKTMARLEVAHDHLTIVDDQLGSPTWAADLAGGLVELAGLLADQRGPEQRVLHCTNTGQTSWYEFARAIFREFGSDPERIRPCASSEFPRPAPRPAYSVLSDRSWREAGLSTLRPWPDALAAAYTTDATSFR